jgi:hypothetical protein
MMAATTLTDELENNELFTNAADSVSFSYRVAGHRV